ncbi:MAG: hypothetical protein IJ154_08100 [Bacteroidales bacterium]|nr:hypothetical protein [Bacteroidales bacterium]
MAAEVRALPLGAEKEPRSRYISLRLCPAFRLQPSCQCIGRRQCSAFRLRPSRQRIGRRQCSAFRLRPSRQRICRRQPAVAVGSFPCSLLNGELGIFSRPPAVWHASDSAVLFGAFRVSRFFARSRCCLRPIRWLPMLSAADFGGSTGLLFDYFGQGLADWGIMRKFAG